MPRPANGFSSLRLLTAGILTAGAPTALGAGFALIEQSASQMGNAFAGGSAYAYDASTIYFNPAGLTRVPHQLLVAGHAVRTTAEFEGGALDLLGNPVASGGDGGDAGTTSFVPNFYYALPLNQNTVFGLGVNVPFGLATDYEDDWVGRYHGVKSELTTININPALAFRISETLSFGAGVSLQYVDAELTQAIDQGSLCVGNQIAGGATPAAAIAFCAGGNPAGSVLIPQQSDAFVKLKADDWSMGLNFGFLFEPQPGTRVGAAFRSKVDHQVHGDGKFSNADPLFTTFQNVFVDSDIEVDATLPHSASLSLYHDVNTKWSVMADVTWTGWESFEELRIEFQDSSQSDSVTEESWNNSMRYAVGVDYRHNGDWTLRGGLAFDESPIPNDRLRTPRIPGEDRTWVALGFGYRMSPAVSIDVGYAHLFVSDPEVDSGGPTIGRLTGEYDAAVDLLSAQLVWNI
jgi:long-chain fatty acid transport protein